MGFTVAHQGGTKDVEFDAYPRLLRQKGMDLAKLNRVPEPGTGRRWLYVWNVEADARAFADELKKRTRDNAWEVVQASLRGGRSGRWKSRSADKATAGRVPCTRAAV